MNNNYTTLEKIIANFKNKGINFFEDKEFYLTLKELKKYTLYQSIIKYNFTPKGFSTKLSDEIDEAVSKYEITFTYDDKSFISMDQKLTDDIINNLDPNQKILYEKLTLDYVKRISDDNKVLKRKISISK